MQGHIEFRSRSLRFLGRFDKIAGIIYQNIQAILPEVPLYARKV